MRALILALLLLASPSYAGETVLSGDSDHTYLPVQSDREVLLHEFTYQSFLGSPLTYTTWSSSWNTNCLQQYGGQGNLGMDPGGRGCSLAANAFRAARPFTVTRVTVFIPVAGAASDPAQFGIDVRVTRVATDGTLTVIGQPAAMQTPGSTPFNLNNEVGVGQGVGIQYRGTGASVALQDYASHPQIQIWGIWK